MIQDVGVPLLRVIALCKRFGTTNALNGVSLDLRRAEVAALIGSSGSGKSTLLRCIDLLEWLDSGSIEYSDGIRVQASVNGKVEMYDPSGKPVPPRSAAAAVRRNFGFVFQGYDLWEEKTVLDNLILAPMIVGCQSRKSAEAKAVELCRRFGLEDKVRSRAWQLSGGQRQRIAIIRALMMRPKLLLLDEVTSSLDPVLTYEVMELIRELKSDGMTMLLVTHHLRFAQAVSDRIIFLHAGQIVQDGRAEDLINSPATPEVAKYLRVLESIG